MSSSVSVAFTPQAFVAKWRKVTLKESAAADEEILERLLALNLARAGAGPGS
jgi:hypothetical protein